MSKLGASGQTPSRETSPCVVFSPTTPQHAAGMRTDPPVSEPRVMSASPSATAATDPDNDPPGTRPGSAGFGGVPNHGLMPLVPNASSWRFVLPTSRPPACRTLRMQAASAAAGTPRSASVLQPAVVTDPSTSMRSFTPTRDLRPSPAGHRSSHVVMPGTIGAGQARNIWLSTISSRAFATGTGG